jgi:hypothetical protein
MEVLIDSPSTWAEIVQSDGWDGPGNQLTLEDITNLSSAAGSIEKVPVTQEIPPLTATLIYNPANAAHAYLRASNAAPFPKTLESFRFTSSAPTPIVSTFSGYVSKFHPAHKAKTSAKVNLEITPTGPLTTT